jgi:flavin-dependent dehydrogenase
MTLNDLDSRYDVMIVGARPAGAATALLLARQGLKVLAIDRGRHGTDTLSTHALMRGGVVQIFRWGVLPAIIAAGTPPVRRATFLYGDETLAVPVKSRDGVDALYAPRRTVLDRALIDAAMASGATVGYGMRLTALHRDFNGRVCGATAADDTGASRSIAAGIVIGADGLRSSVARFVGAPVTRLGRWAAAVVYGYWSGLPVDGYRWYYHAGLSVGAIPTNDGLTCVFAAVPDHQFAAQFRGQVVAGYLKALEAGGDDLVERIRAGALDGGLHGFPGQRGYFRRSAGPGWALVGDAGYFKDPVTAHGITDALIDAETLARAVAAGTDGALDEYERQRDARAGALFEVTDRLASFEWTMDEARALHKRLAEEMAREARGLRDWTLEEATA